MSTLNINDAFWTFQGEGANAGKRALFVRMPFCNLACTWCDTEFNSFKRWSLNEFNDLATSEPSRFAVITGGEPMLNKHTHHFDTMDGILNFTMSEPSVGFHGYVHC